MTFKKIDKNQDFADNSLQCASAGCTNRWSVQLDGRPKCSHHQWFGIKPIQYGHMDSTIGEYQNDKKGWAKRIIDRHENGYEIASISLKFARQALKIFD